MKFGLRRMRYNATAVATDGAGFLDDFGQAHRQQNHSMRDEALESFGSRVQQTCESGSRDNDGLSRGGGRGGGEGFGGRIGGNL